jgi:mannose-6-phosphate isomerase class I
MSCVTCIGGEGIIIHDDKIYDIKRGESYFLPAGMGKCKIEGNAVFIAAKYRNG